MKTFDENSSFISKSVIFLIFLTRIGVFTKPGQISVTAMLPLKTTVSLTKDHKKNESDVELYRIDEVQHECLLRKC
jgi:hypothetical protein